MLFKKEKEVFSMMQRHADQVEECVRLAVSALLHYINGEIKDAKMIARQVDNVESQADKVRSQIRDMLYSGAYMPLLREDIYRLVKQIDALADGAEAASDFFLNQRPVIPVELRPCFNEALQTSLSVIPPFKEALSCFMKGDCEFSTIHAHSVEIARIEAKMDKMRWDKTKKIFTANLEYAHKIHLKTGLDAIVGLSDLAKSISDQIEISTMKSLF